MNRWVLFSVCAILGLVMLVGGLLVPMHLRAVDAGVIARAGRNSPSLIDQGLALAQHGQLSTAQMLLQAAEAEGVPGRERLAATLDTVAAQNPDLRVWGDAPPRWVDLFSADAKTSKAASQPFTGFAIRLENREKLLEYLRSSPMPVVQDLLRTRQLTNTTVFSPSQSSSGQAFDAAVSIGGLLAAEGHFTTALRDEFSALAAEATRGNSRPLEESLLDLMSLGQRLSWGQLAAFTARIENVETLRLLAGEVRNAGGQLPVLFSAVQLSGRPAELAKYLANFSQTGLNDAGTSLRYGAGGVNELLRRDQRLYNDSGFQRTLAERAPFEAFFRFAADYCWLMPRFALGMKWFLYLCGGFLMAMAMHFARPTVSALEQPLQVRGIHVAREILFALGFLLVVLLLSEPFLAQESQKVAFHFRLAPPTTGVAVPAGAAGAHPSTFMNPKNLLTLLLFFVLQGLIYIACLVKLAEIRRQHVVPRIKLKLLENEDHLFDAGLYLGFVGTIISLILVSLGVIEFSLMAAYSSTSFGIVFVSIFKIFHLRPARRKLLLESEAVSPEAAAPVQGAPSFATYS